MKPLLLLNHAFLQGISSFGTESVRVPLVDLGLTLERARKLRRHATLYVHPHLNQADIGNGTLFVRWAHSVLKTREWGALLQPLLELLSGPFVQELELDDVEPPTDFTPTCPEAPDWLRELVLTAGHHALSRDASGWILSYGHRPFLDQLTYRFARGDHRAEVSNFRSDQEIAKAEAALALQATQTTRSILDEAERHARRVVVLDRARKTADNWTLDCNPERLFASIVGLDLYAKALDEGMLLEQAAQTYWHTVQIEMSRETGNLMRRPSEQKKRSYLLPDGSTQLFEMHAKPGQLTRVHVFARREKRKNGEQEVEETVVYVGHCGRHL